MNADRIRNAVLGAWAVVVFIFLFTPIAVIVVYSFNSGTVLARWSGFGFNAYVDAINNDVIVSSVVTPYRSPRSPQPSRPLSAPRAASHWRG